MDVSDFRRAPTDAELTALLDTQLAQQPDLTYMTTAVLAELLIAQGLMTLEELDARVAALRAQVIARLLATPARRAEAVTAWRLAHLVAPSPTPRQEAG